MPKNKTHSGAAKRFRVTKPKKSQPKLIMRAQAGIKKKLEKKTAEEKRRLTGLVVVAKGDTKRVKRMLGI